MLVKPENKAMVTKVLTYHLISGNIDSKAIAKSIKTGNGKAEFTTAASKLRPPGESFFFFSIPPCIYI